jgi:dienelactone hydrolase
VIGLHGCGGLNNRAGSISVLYRDWGQRLAAAGFAVIFPDSYGSRGLGSLCRVSSRAARSSRERVTDAEAALAWLQAQSWVRSDRVSLVGWSSGATSALWAVRPRASHQRVADFRSAVALYPGCGRLNTTAWSARVPTLVLIGAADEASSAAVCQQMIAGARGRSARAVIHVYPGAYHDFDHPSRAVHVRSGYAYSLDGSGRIHSGTSAAARGDALKRVPEWLAR